MLAIDFHFKESLHQLCLSITEDKINRLRKLLESSQQDLNTATKSTAGDKHETARAMIHIELENQTKQLIAARKTSSLLSQVKVNPMKIAQLGALIQTNKGLFYMAVGMGKVILNHKDTYVISPASPIGQKLLGAIVNDCIHFNDQEYKIEKIL